MTRKTDIEPKKTLSTQDIADYLRANPDFLPGLLRENPDLLQALAPGQGGNVVDMQNFVLRKLQSDNRALRESNLDLAHSGRGSSTAQQRIHGAVIAILSATCFEDLLHILANDLVMHLGIDIASLCIEADNVFYPGAAQPGVQIIDPYFIEDVMGQKLVKIRGNIAGDPMLFGAGAGLVKSDALIRLFLADGSVDAVLALGSRDKDGMQGFSAELLGFLGQITGIAIRNWLMIGN